MNTFPNSCYFSLLKYHLSYPSTIQAFQLWWKNVSFIQHPRYSNPAYREEASIHDRELSCSWAMNHPQDEGSDSTYMSENTGAGRCFAWRDAKWPWA